MTEHDKAYLGWPQFGDGMTMIAQFAEETDTVIGIARGGLPGAVALSHLLDADLSYINADYYDGEERKERISVSGVADPPDEGDSVLLFDDIVDTGHTMTKVEQELRRMDIEDIETAVLFYKPSSMYEPDIWVEETDQWVVFPWEGSL